MCFPFATGLPAAHFLLHTKVQRIYALLQAFRDLVTTQLSAVLPARKYSSSIASYCSTAFSAELESAAMLLCVSQVVFLCDSQIALQQTHLRLCSWTCCSCHLSPWLPACTSVALQAAPGAGLSACPGWRRFPSP